MTTPDSVLSASPLVFATLQGGRINFVVTAVDTDFSSLSFTVGPALPCASVQLVGPTNPSVCEHRNTALFSERACPQYQQMQCTLGYGAGGGYHLVLHHVGIAVSASNDTVCDVL